MSILQALFLGLLQGLTEFLPVSSSGHLVLVERLWELPVAENKLFDVTLHLGTGLALIVYFWRDLLGMLREFFKFLFGTWKVQRLESLPQARLAFYLLLATLPAVLVGFTLNDWIDQSFREPWTVSVFLILIALLFFWADRRPMTNKLGLKNTFIVGCAQALALFPGISRSGITIASARMQQVSLLTAARFSFLLSLPAILGAGVLTFLKNTEALDWQLVSVGFLSSFLASLLAIRFLLGFFKQHGLKLFAYYRILLALSLLLFYFLS